MGMCCFFAPGTPIAAREFLPRGDPRLKALGYQSRSAGLKPGPSVRAPAEAVRRSPEISASAERNLLFAQRTRHEWAPGYNLAMPDLLTELDDRSSQILIQPAFQRMFRWSQAQQSRLIESMLLGLPVPQIVLFQREDGVLELIDGLQRVSSIIRFITGKTPKASDDQDDMTNLQDCDLLPSLNGQVFASLDSVVQLELKRKTLRAIVIKRTNDPNLRYEMFKRLNAGGSPAEAQEVRNASLRIAGKNGEQFLAFFGAML